jgi:hypothetical protein
MHLGGRLSTSTAGVLIYCVPFNDIPVGAYIALVLTIVFPVVGLILLATKFLVKRSKPGVLGKWCGGFEYSLKNRTNQSLLNNICYRQATDPRDLCFGILPML